MANFRTFTVGTTNIFPAANSVAGGQLLSEFNLRCREGVGVGPIDSTNSIDYFVGPSYVHSMSDFTISKYTDEVGQVISNSVIQISEGRALINGHYVESLAPMIVDLTEANATYGGGLKGHLAIGFRAMYSGENTLNGHITSKTYGSLAVEGEDDIYDGIQTVILPFDQFILPEDSPKDLSKVTAHILLGDFYYTNGRIKSITINDKKCCAISADRIGNMNKMLSEGYMPQPNINPNLLYVLAGKRSESSESKELTWCDARDSLMVWDTNPTTSTEKPSINSAQFQALDEQTVALVIPHKQVDGQTPYLVPKVLPLPVADYATGSPGIVSNDYTKRIKGIADKVNNLYEGAPGGKLKKVISSLSQGRPELPIIGADWAIGDYILVCQDMSVVSEGSGSFPSTMYVVSPGYVESVGEGKSRKPSDLTGCQLEVKVSTSAPDIINSEVYSSYWGTLTEYSGTTEDYFTYEQTSDKGSNFTYYPVKTTGPKVYSQPVFLTGQIPLASDSAIGGFLNCSETDLDGGYIWLDETGHLRLLDYGLLRTGTLAYQLGQDMASETSLTLEGLQDWLDQNVNDRVVFPNRHQTANSSYPNVIHLTITLPDDSNSTSNNLYIRGLDSRFGASIYLHILGSATSKTTVHIVDCEKIRIDSSVTASTQVGPNITLTRSCLYYDAAILDYLWSIDSLSLWYEQVEDTDPDIFVNGLTVRIGSTESITVEDIDFWSEEVDNDNHIQYALCGVTFDRGGTIVGADIFIRNIISADTDTASQYVAIQEFVLPQSSALRYPESKLTLPIKITGNFINGYDGTDSYVLNQVTFSAVTGKYNSESDETDTGTISMLVQRYSLPLVAGNKDLAGWDVDSSHMFSGWVEK